MALTPAEVADRARAAQRERIARAFEQRGRSRSAASPAGSRAAARREVASLPPQILGKDQLVALLNAGDRERVVEGLKAQAARARELLAEEKAKKRPNRDDVRKYKDIIRYSEAGAAQIDAGSGGLTGKERVAAGRSRNPAADIGELRRRYGTPEQRRGELFKEHRQDALAQAMADAGFTGTRDEFRAQQAMLAQAAAQEQRERFVASGQSKQASAVEVKRATASQIKKGTVAVIDPVTNQPLKIVGETAIGVRAAAPRAETSVQPVPLGVSRDARGNLVYVREGGRATAKEIFAEQGAPERTLLGEITFGRPKEYLIKKEGLLPEVSIPRSGEEASRTSKVYDVEYTVGSAAEARFAGFPTVDTSGAPISFPAKFTGLEEQRTDFARKGVLDKPVQYFQGKLLAVDTKARAIAQTYEKDRGDRTLTEQLLRPAARVIKGVEAVGANVEKAGDFIATQGERLEATPLVRAQLVVAPITRNLPGSPANVARTAEIVGGVVEEEGRTLRERPVTGGVGEALVVGTAFGGFARVAKLTREAGFVIKAGTRVEKVGVLARSARILGGSAVVTEKTAGYALGGAFALQTGSQVAKAESGREVGAVVGKAGRELLAFGVGARYAGAPLGDAAFASARAVSRVTFAGGREFVALNREVLADRRGEVGGRSARQRSGRMSQAQLRQRKPNPSAPKYEVTSDKGTVSVALRGKARQDTDALRVLEAQFERGGRTEKQIYRDAQIEVLKLGGGKPKSLIGGELAFPGERSPRIEPSNREPSFLSLRPVLGKRTGRKVRASAESEGSRSRETDRIAGELVRIKERPLAQGTPRVESGKVLGAGRTPFGKGPDQLRAENRNAGESDGSVLESVAQGKQARKRGKMIKTQEPAIAQRNKSVPSEYRQRAPIQTVAPDYGAPDLTGAPAGLRDRALEYARGSPEYRRLVVSERLRVLREGRARELDQKRVEEGSLEKAPRGIPTEERALGSRSGLREADSSGKKFRSSMFNDLGRELGRGFRSKSFTASLLGAAERFRAVPDVMQLSDTSTLLSSLSLVKQKTKQEQEQEQKGGFDLTQEPYRPGPNRPNERRGPDPFEPEPVDPFRPTPKPPFEPPTIQKGFDRGDFQRLGAKGFGVFLKRGGSFRRLPGVFSEGGAILLGARKAGAGAAQTFEIRPLTGSLTEVKEPTALQVRAALRTFKRKGNLFREERGHALIDTVGEVIEIQRLGVRASQRSRL